MQHRIVSRDEWLAARKQLLVKEKELTRRRDQFAAQAALPVLGALGRTHADAVSTTRPKIDLMMRGGKASRSPPPYGPVGLSPRPEHELARGIENARNDELALGC